uniref:Coiled-coil domain-containing protein 138 n=1 Tax=Phallusia mammillata TaxID=59560 RepID=A0A6F9D8N6_9ASCI|nr:coiled-coil domain-containing protein 138 [Phallusia mammillata]
MEERDLKQFDVEDSDSYVEHLRKKYLQNSLLTSQQTGCDTESGSELLSCSPSNSLSESEKHHYQRAMRELKAMLKSSNNVLKAKQTEDQLAQITEEKLSDTDTEEDILQVSKDIPNMEDAQDSAENTLTISATLPTMSSEYTAGTNMSPSKRKSVRISLEPATFLNSELSSGMEVTWPPPGILRTSSEARPMESTDVKVIHSELMNIHRKLIEKSEMLSERQDELDEREQELIQREENVADQEEMLAMNLDRVRRAQDVMVRLQGVEAEVEDKLDILQENHLREMDELSNALNEKIKEVKRIRNSFDVVKLQNDELKQQVTELSQQNQRFQMQNTKMKKRLENLQRKQEYESQKKANSQILAERLPPQQIQKPKLEDLKSSSKLAKSMDRSSKIWNYSVESLSVVLEWVCEVYLQPLIVRNNYDVQSKALHTSKEYVTDKCLKVLPMLVDVIRYLTVSTQQPKHHLPFLCFVYWSLHHLEDTHHTILTSTARRIGEELVKPAIGRSQLDPNASVIASQSISLQLSMSTSEGKSRSQIFFRSPNPEVRLLSALIILRTLNQVDLLAQIFDQVKKDLKEESNRKLFLKYCAVKSLLPFLTYKSSKGLLGSAVDLMLQMSIESELLPEFLDSCSCETWFKAVSSAVRAIIQSADDGTLEKLCVILQKLSKNKTNRRLFESYSIGRTLLEKFRECDPESNFLSLNLRSILFNLNMLKS